MPKSTQSNSLLDRILSLIKKEPSAALAEGLTSLKGLTSLQRNQIYTAIEKTNWEPRVKLLAYLRVPHRTAIAHLDLLKHITYHTKLQKLMGPHPLYYWKNQWKSLEPKDFADLIQVLHILCDKKLIPPEIIEFESSDFTTLDRMRLLLTYCLMTDDVHPSAYLYINPTDVEGAKLLLQYVPDIFPRILISATRHTNPKVFETLEAAGAQWTRKAVQAALDRPPHEVPLPLPVRNAMLTHLKQEDLRFFCSKLNDSVLLNVLPLHSNINVVLDALVERGYSMHELLNAMPNCSSEKP